ncbi:MAG: hypothetical protein IT358_08565, partial [Gemmatimonadaceae bacterium]|nr:hypothetical protein [Gemmatimonadaceae bacterium]
MSMDRRQLLGALGGIAAVRGLGLTSDSENARNAPVATMPPPGAALPRKADFAIEEGTTFLNAAYTHPIPRVSVEAARRAAEWRGTMRPT